MNDSTNTPPVMTPADVKVPDNYKPVTAVFVASQLQNNPDGSLSDAQQAIVRASKFAAAREWPVLNNYDVAAGLQPGYALSIIPLSKNKEHDGGREMYGLAIAALPTMDAIMGAEGGADFVADTMLRVMRNKVAAAYRPREDGSTPTVPSDVVDFITSQRAAQSLEAWRALGARFVKALKKKKKGFRKLNPTMLRQVLMSKEAAEQYFSTVPQHSWETMLDAMIELAKQNGMHPGAIQEWRETRDTALVETGEEFEADDILSALDA